VLIYKKRNKLGTRIEREFTFQAAVHFEGNFVMNLYDVSISMEVLTDSIKEQNIAMDRIMYFLGECLSNSVFIHQAELEAIEKYYQANIKVCTLPEHPYDQIITLLVLLKLNSIVEDKLLLTDIVLVSELSNQVKFLYDIETASNHPFGKGWWTESNLVISNTVKHRKKDKVVKLIKSSDWATIGLDWDDKPKKRSEIIFNNIIEK